MFAVAVLPAAQTQTVRRMAPFLGGRMALFLGGCVGVGQLAEPVVYRLGREDRLVRDFVHINLGLRLLLALTRRRA
jgi:hypothetical protein